MDNWKDSANNSNTATVETTVTAKKYTVYDLWQQAWSMAGKSLFYMQFIWPNTDWGGQKERVERMCYYLAEEQKNHIKETEENKQWFRDWMKKFEDEVENQC